MRTIRRMSPMRPPLARTGAPRGLMCGNRASRRENGWSGDSGPAGPEIELPRQERVYPFGRERRAHPVSLHLIAAEPLEMLELILGLDPLGDDIQFQTVRQLDDGTHDACIRRVRSHFRDERTVDLQGVNREAFEVVEGGIPGTEVVDCD